MADFLLVEKLTRLTIGPQSYSIAAIRSFRTRSQE